MWKRNIYLFLLILFALSGCKLFQRPARPVKLDKKTADKITRDIEKERADSIKWLAEDPTSYLAASDRIDFNQKKSLTVGSAEDNDLRLRDIEPHELRVTVVGNRFQVECIDPNARFKIKEAEKRGATVDPSYIKVGRYTLRLSHQRFPALVVFDSMLLPLKEFYGPVYFPVDLSYRYELPLRRYSKPEKIVIMSTRNNARSAERVGWVDFLVGDTQCRLEVTRLIEPGSEDELQVLFRDATSGNESYELGRYVDLQKLENGKYLLDFNLAYNPACAFSQYYNCPIPPKANTLKVKIRAGEKDPLYHPVHDSKAN